MCYPSSLLRLFLPLPQSHCVWALKHCFCNKLILPFLKAKELSSIDFHWFKVFHSGNSLYFNYSTVFSLIYQLVTVFVKQKWCSDQSTKWFKYRLLYLKLVTYLSPFPPTVDAMAIARVYLKCSLKKEN